MEYTGERVIPNHGDLEAQGNYDAHVAMYKEFLETTRDREVIDVACGCGHGSKMISGIAKKVYGYDISPEAVKFAKKYFQEDNIEYNVGDIKKLPHKDESIDTIISVEVFEHVLPIEDVIKEVHRIIKPKGFWCFTTPNGYRYPDHRIVKWHLKHYNAQELHTLLDPYFNIHIRETGIEPDSSVYMGRPIFGNYSVICVKK